MTYPPTFEVSVRRSYLFSSSIVGFARIVIDKQILLKEVPIFGGEGNSILVKMSIEPVAACPDDMDMKMLNRMVWSLNHLIEKAVIEKWYKIKNGTLN